LKIEKREKKKIQLSEENMKSLLKDSRGSEILEILKKTNEQDLYLKGR
jgi:hypothetical protein